MTSSQSPPSKILMHTMYLHNHRWSKWRSIWPIGNCHVRCDNASPNISSTAIRVNSSMRRRYWANWVRNCARTSSITIVVRWSRRYHSSPMPMRILYRTLLLSWNMKSSSQVGGCFFFFSFFRKLHTWMNFTTDLR